MDNEKTTPEEKIPAGFALLKEVSETIKSSTTGATIVARVKEQLIEAEVASRTDLLKNGLRSLELAQSELRKIKGVIPGYSADGKPLPEVWTKDQIESKKKAEEKLAKITKAIDLAINDNDFSKLKELKS